MKRALLSVLGVIVLADLAQPLLLPWKAKFFGALGGALIYGLCAVGIARDVAAARWVVLLMPVIPTTVIALHLGGVGVPAPDGAMIGIYALQLSAAIMASRMALPTGPPVK